VAYSTYQYNEDHYVSLVQRAQISPPNGPPFEGYVTADGTDVGWRLVSQGPDQVPNFLDAELQSLGVWARDALEYDPTNGTVSKGDVIRYGGPDRGSLYQ
jgi:hypothetical protein